MGWWRSAWWSDLRVALIMMMEEREAQEEAMAERGDGGYVPKDSGTFGSPPPAHVLALLPTDGGR